MGMMQGGGRQRFVAKPGQRPFVERASKRERLQRDAAAQGELLGFKTIIRPSAEAIHRHSQAIREAVRRYSNAPQASLIARLNPLIRGWTNYYAAAASSRTFSTPQAWRT
jgi:hypothetical protein